MKKVVTFLLTLLMVFLNVQNATAQSLQNNTLNSVASFSFFGEEASLFTNDVSFYEVSKDLNFVEVNSDDKENTTTVLTSITQANIFTVVNAWLANPIATALHFDGANDYVDATVSVATALPVGNAARSVEFTIKTGQTSIGNIVSWGTQANNGERSSFSVRDGKVGFIGANKDVTGSVTINDNTEHNIAITYDGSNLTGFKFYVDGVLDPGPYTFNQNNSGVSINTLGQNLILGKNASPSNIEYYNGILENVRIWDKELSAVEVSSYAGQTIPTSTANLVAYFNFNEGTPNADNTSLTTVSDLKGNYNGTLTNFAKNGTTSNWVNGVVDATAPTFTSATAVDFTENASGVAYTIAATDDSAITYSLGSGNDEASFTLNGAEVSFVSSPNFETKASYTINVIATDALNNAANQDVVITILDEDEVAPTVVISSSVSGPTETSPIPVIITFNETVTGFDSSDISVSGGTIQNFVGSDATYGFDLVPAGNGTLTVDIAADVAQDGAGNNNTIASQFSIEYIEEIIPTLVTNSATGVSLTAATLSGSITDLGTKTIVEKGIMISDVNTNPTIPGAATVKYIDLSAGNGISITRTGLSIATQYYFRAYVIDSNGVTHYADVKTFTTSAHIAPALTTSAASGVTLTNAVLEGTITTSGTRTISEKGILLSSINISPILDGADVEKNIDSGSGTIIRTIKTDLTKATTYYFRAFLTVSDGTTFYGDVSTFTTLSSTVATVLTTAVNNVDLTSATFAGNVTSDGDASGGVSERGIVYAIKTANANPEIGGTGVIKNENGSGTGTYSELISGLASGTEYSYRAYAINTEGTAYGNIFTFTTAFAELETTDASNITTTSAMFAGKVLNAGGNTFTEEGVVYSISRINNDPVIGGTGAQRLELEYDNNSYFLGTAIGLNVSTQYAYKAYAISTSGNITYGPLKTFTTDSAFDDQKIGQWDFEGGSTADSTGNWGDLNLGAANITNGKLDVDAGDLVRTTSYSGSAITTKTLVSFAEIQDLNVRSGSIISMDGITTDNFNAIVYAEREANRWMNGSTTFRRTVNLTPGFAETTANIPVMMAITYAETPSGINFITVYRNGVNIGSYFTPGVKSNWTANNVEVLFGARHSNSNAIGGIDALIDKAIIYDRALSPTELNTLYQGSFEKPLVTTTAASSLGITTATLTGNVTSNGGTSITETGFVYSETLENSDPEIGGNEAVKVLSTNGLGVFNESITGLSGGTDYSFRAYAKNDLGTTYGDVLTFKTSNPSAPTVTTNAVTSVTAFEALFSSNVTDDGGADIEDVGVLFAETSINSNPIVTDTNIIKVGAEDVSSFSETVKNLKPNTQYSYKAYADNDTEFGYGSVLTFTTLATTGTVVTNVATSIQETSAVFSGEATDDGGTTITETGIVYALTATNATPEISGTGVTKDDNGSALGSFSESISGLTDGAQYSYRAYVINSEGTAYGDVLTLTTIETPPAGVASITTTAAQVITQNSAVIAGNISSDNGASVTTRGIVYAKTSVSTLPTIGDPEVNNISIGNGIGAFNTNATALRASTSYSFRAYAINSAGTSYGDVATFTTSALETFLPSGLMGHWDFENGSLVDKTGNWSDLTLGTNTTIVNGKLDLNRGSLANSTTYTGATIKEKTLVAYLELQDLSVRAGSALTIDGVSNDNFDGIVFAEKEANKWMAGSSYFKRTSTPLNPGFEETTVGEPIMMAITYTETSNGLAKVKIYRNGILIGNYTKGAIATWSSGNIEVLFGRRHTNPTRGELDALIDEALIFNRPLSANEILTLYQNSINTTTVATTSVHSIGNASGVFGGNVLNDGGDEITDRGIVYAEKATNASPEIGGTGVSKVQISSGTGAFGEKITDFISSTTYTYRAYAINSRGTVYGEIEEFTTLDIACAITPDYSSVNQQAWRYFHGQYFVAPCDGVILSLSLRSSRANPDIGIRIAEELPGYNREIGFVDNLALSDNSADVNSRSVLDLSSASVNVEQGKVYYFTFRSLAENEPIYYSDDNSYSPRGSILNGYLHDGGDRDLVFEMEFGPKQEVTDDITTFTAGSNNSFADARNWDKGKPGENASVAVKNGVVMTVDQNDVELDDFRLNSGATLDIPEDKEVIVNGDFNTDGSLSLDSNENNSGVLFIKGTTSGTVTYKRGGLLANKWSIISAPVSGQKIVEFAQNEDNDIRVNTNVSPNRYAIGYYDDSLPSNRWQYFNTGTPAADTFEIGRSYSMSRATDGEVTFTGTLEVGNVNQSVTTGRWQAIGNPYTTFLAANKNESSSFLEDNLALLDDLFQGLYIWDNDQEKYVAVTQIDTDNRSIPPGQGFFIRTKSTTNVVFNENKRQLQPSVGNTGFNKSANPEMILSVTNGTAKVSTKIKYFANATRGFDVGYDYGNFGSSQLDVFTHLLEGSEGTDFTIQSLPLKDMNNVRIPVGITAKAGQEITFSLEKISLEEGLNIYLEDKLLDTLTPLSEIEDTYKISISEDTNGIGRFYLTTSSKALGNDDFNLKETISIFTTNTNELKIVGISLGGKVSVQLFNTLGKEVGAFRIDNAEVQNTIDLNNFSRGVYFVRLKSDKSSISKKIVLE